MKKEDKDKKTDKKTDNKKKETKNKNVKKNTKNEPKNQSEKKNVKVEAKKDEKKEVVRKEELNKEENINKIKKDTVRIIFAVVLVIILLGAYVYKTASTKKYARDFKEEYEKINDKKIGEHKYRKITIPSNNPFRHVSQNKIITMLKENKTFYLYVGDEKCPWCRSVIEKAAEIANKKGIKEIYYVNIWDKDYNEILRDKYKVTDAGELEKVNSSTDLYKLMLKRFDSKLTDYTLTDNEGKTVKVGEKRIYAPTYFYIENGKVKRMTTALSDKQEGAYDTLTSDILKDEEKDFNELFK